MWALIRRYPLGFGLAAIIHLVLVAVMVFGLDWLHPPKPHRPKVQVVQARLVDARQQRTAHKRQKRMKRRRKAALERQRKLEAARKRKAALERKKRLEAERRRKVLERKKAEIEHRRRLALQRRAAEKKRKAELERKRRLEEKKRREAEAKRKAELERKKKLEAERRRKEAERKRKEAARKRAEAERKKREAELAAQLQGEKEAREREQVIAAIKRKVENNWIRPPSLHGQTLQAKVRVRVGADGSVLAAEVVESSGNPAFDRSATAAVYRADPLPMPSSARLVREFRDFTFIFKPINQ